MSEFFELQNQKESSRVIITQTLTCHSFAILRYLFTDKPIVSTCNITSEDGILRVAFDASGDGSQTAKDIAARLDEMIETGELNLGDLLKVHIAEVNVPESLPRIAAMVMVSQLSHLFEAMAVFDPKLNKYIVAISHSPKYAIGDLIDLWKNVGMVD
ncbi:MAG: hypothetical protein OXU36_13305 [Candidatus Poribacteria bacterium]|nr:hypothetical protein [Candidatus Poribacteria bacterium]